ncbi:iron complex transport system permease protein [Skermanella aerolata]|uniref:Uncharacterized protein n=1 Tax=Skermanella aerolata TaxID=393310 RepID=A0A512DKB0_9PROT|nr:hypothetical protein [Skermanella aerolata]GEO36914.1 hypothetical protein SAE02_10620 [Skermanella aerolata]
MSRAHTNTADAGAAPLARLYGRFVWSRLAVIGILVAALLVSVLFDVATGPSPLSVADIVTGLLDRGALPRGQAVTL